MTRLCLICLCVALMGVSGCQRPEKEPVPESQVEVEVAPRLLELSKEALARAELGIAEAQPGVMATRLHLQGDVEVDREKIAYVVSQISGIVQRVNVGLGQAVTKGEVLAELESRELADLKMAYVENEHQLKYLKAGLVREKQLWNKNITAKEEYITKKHEVAQAEIAHSKGLHRLRLLGYGEKYLHSLVEEPDQDTISILQLRAPLSGEVIQKDLIIGQSVQAEHPLFQLADLSELMVRFHLPIKYLQGIAPGHAIQVDCESTGFRADGTVTYLSSLVTEATRTISVLARISNPNGSWRPGMAVKVALTGGQSELLVSIPLSAAQDVNGQETVFVQKAPFVFELRSVTLGKRDDDIVEVVHGLASGEKVVSDNAYLLKAEWFNRSGE